jgi:hypothetical protein
VGRFVPLGPAARRIEALGETIEEVDLGQVKVSAPFHHEAKSRESDREILAAL